MQELRLVVLQRDNYTCQRCKKQPKISDVHHIIPLGESDGGTNDLDNLISLCPKCHKEVEPATYKGWKRGSYKLDYAIVDVAEQLR